MENIKS